MNKKAVTDSEHQSRYSEAIRDARRKGDAVFQSWFNKSEDENQSILQGYWDLSVHILKPKVCEYIISPESKTALEIGYGGGRILNAACSYFHQVIGIDIHEEQAAVQEFLHGQGKENFILLKTGGRTIDVESGSIDFIYSFIVLMHLNSYEAFESYIRETQRCLKRGGIAQLYFGTFRKATYIQRFIYSMRGYIELPDAPVNYTSLLVNVPRIKRIARKLDLRILETGHSYKTVPTGYPGKPGGQDYVTLLKP